MGILYVNYINNYNEYIYVCKHCNTHLTSDIYNNATTSIYPIQGFNNGQCVLFNELYNITTSYIVQNIQFTTGCFDIVFIYCMKCSQYLGFQYINCNQHKIHIDNDIVVIDNDSNIQQYYNHNYIKEILNNTSKLDKYCIELQYTKKIEIEKEHLIIDNIDTTLYNID